MIRLWRVTHCWINPFRINLWEWLILINFSLTWNSIFLIIYQYLFLVIRIFFWQDMWIKLTLYLIKKVMIFGLTSIGDSSQFWSKIINCAKVIFESNILFVEYSEIPLIIYALLLSSLVKLDCSKIFFDNSIAF